MCITQQETIDYVGTQILYPDGTSEFKKLYPKPSDEFLHERQSDKDFTESFFIRLLYVLVRGIV